jgi:hypothetical protein
MHWRHGQHRRSCTQDLGRIMSYSCCHAQDLLVTLRFGAIWRGCSYARDMFTRSVFFTHSGIRVARLVRALCQSKPTPMPVSPSPFRSQYKPKKYDICLFSVNLVLALRPLVRSRSLPAHLRVALPRRRILLRTRIQPLRHLRQRLPLRKARPPLALVYLDRWPPPRAPSPSDQLLAMASRRCFLAAAPSLHL